MSDYLDDLASQLASQAKERGFREDRTSLFKTGAVNSSEATRTQLNESGETGTDRIATIPVAVMGVLQRAYATAIAPDIVFHKATPSPKVTVQSKRFKTTSAILSADGNLPANSDIFGTAAALYQGAYSTSNLGSATSVFQDLTNHPNTLNLSTPYFGSAGLLSDANSGIGNTLAAEIVQETVEAKLRMLSAKLNAAAVLMASSQGVDLASDTLEALGVEIAAEKDNEIIRNLKHLAGTIAVFNQRSVTGYVGDSLASIAALMNAMSAEIAAKTRTGGANWAVMTPKVVAALLSAQRSNFQSAVTGNISATANSSFAGTMNGDLAVYKHLNSAYAGDNTILLGRRGVSETDQGYMVFPFQPLFTALNGVASPESLNKTYTLASMEAHYAPMSADSSLGNATNYFARITVPTIDFN